jgi:hypothetical protein
MFRLCQVEIGLCLELEPVASNHDQFAVSLLQILDWDHPLGGDGGIVGGSYCVELLGVCTAGLKALRRA